MREPVALGGALTVPARAWPEEFVLNPGAEIWVQNFVKSSVSPAEYMAAMGYDRDWVEISE